MKIIGIDTSTMTGGVALVSTEGFIGEYTLNIRTNHTERLLPAIHQVLQDAETELTNLDGIGVVIGPGSYTGLRIGVATAKAFGFSLGIKVWGVTVLEALAYQFESFPGLVVPLVDARRQEVYAQVWQGNKEQTKPENLPLAELLTRLEKKQEPLLFAGDGAIQYETMIRSKIDWAEFPHQEMRVLLPRSVAALALRYFQQGEERDVFHLNPVYMRKTEAEIKWEQKVES